MPPDAQSAVANARLDMDLKRLRWIAVAAPLMIVIALEVIRAATAGEVPLQTRLVLDAVVVVAFAIFGVVMVRAIGDINEQLKRQNRELLALHSAGLDVAAELSLDAVLKKVVDQARNLVGAKYGALSVVDAEQGRIKSFLTSGITPEEREAIGPPPVGHGVLGVVLHEGQRLRLEDIAKHPRSVGFPANHPMMRTLLAVPITCKSPFVGNLYLAEKENDERFTDDDEKTLERFAVQAAIAIDNAHLHQQVGDLAVAQERLRIAHEMHDGIAQVLGYVNTKVQAANEYLRRGKNEEASGQLRELAVAAREAYGDVREAIVDLRTLPSPQQSFADAMREYINRWKEQTGISTHVTIDGDLSLNAGAELQLVRIIQESLANVRKHARATTATVDVRRRDGGLEVTIADDGIGFNPGARGRGDFPQFGLPTMQERAATIGGKLEIESRPGRGTTVRLHMPLT
ncbi:MAG TPA: GAF domain-containing sensor histidine kinase [Thermoanaerobaculia bacterium]|nr:GAF domain-containing sensor histidine kinase [Thermoanaerobaculia bacterium]